MQCARSAVAGCCLLLVMCSTLRVPFLLYHPGFAIFGVYTVFVYLLVYLRVIRDLHGFCSK